MASSSDQHAVVDERHIVSKLRLAPTREALAEAEWDDKTTTWMFDIEEDNITTDYGDLKEYAPFRDARPLALNVAARYWEEDLDLPALLERLAREAGMEPVYRGVTSTSEPLDE